MHVNILMGTFDGARWIAEQLDSFLGQTHPYWTLWVSDDGSTDDTCAQLEAFAKSNPGRVAKILDGPRQGSAANFLHLLCHPDLPPGIVALSDQDDVWLPRKLERAVEQLNAAGSAPCVWSARYMIGSTDLRASHASELWTRGPSLENALVQNILSGHTLTLNPAALALVRSAGRQKVRHHDWWIYLVMMACGARSILDPEIVLNYRQHSSNVIGGRSSLLAKRKRFFALMQGEMGDLIKENLEALHAAQSLPITASAANFLRRWHGSKRFSKLYLLWDLKIHRQSRNETALLYLAAILRKL